MIRAKLKPILFDPVAWIHPRRFVVPDLFGTPRCKSLLNDGLIRHYQLPVEGIDSFDSLACCFIDNWKILPRAAFMLACMRHRSQLAFGGQLTLLDGPVRQFALLSLVEVCPDVPQILNNDQLWRLALQELLLFGQQLPAILAQRIPLLFPEGETTSKIRIGYQPNALNLRLAIQHVQRTR